MSWSTHDEIVFLRNIGRHRHEPKDGALLIDDLDYRRKVLKGYIASAKHRARWGAINPEIAVEEARLLLSQLQRP